MDPNSSIKSNRGSFWVKKISFVAESLPTNSLESTCVLCIASKSGDHEHIEHLYMDEIKELSTGRKNISY